MLGCDYPKIHVRHIEAPAQLTSLQIAHDLTGGGAGSEGDAMGQGGYRFLSESIGGLSRSPYPSRLREASARDWSACPESIEDLHAHLSSELLRLRAAILASPPAYRYGIRHLLAESETANLVWLPTHRSP